MTPKTQVSHGTRLGTVPWDTSKIAYLGRLGRLGHVGQTGRLGREGQR